jgi:hypothetical protein
MYYSRYNEYPISWEEFPDRIRMPTGLTRTSKITFTEDEIAAVGYVPVSDPPQINEFQSLKWTGTEWEVVDIDPAEVNAKKWEEIRKQRNNRIESLTWRIQRYESEVRQELTPTEDIAKLDRYIQALRDITKQEDPFDLSWPTLDEVSNTQINSNN